MKKHDNDNLKIVGIYENYIKGKIPEEKSIVSLTDLIEILSDGISSLYKVE